MTVQSLLQGKGDAVFSIAADERVCECIRVLNEKRIGALMVLDAAGVVLGIVSERDILHQTFDTKGKLCDKPVGDIMTPAAKLITASTNDSLTSVMEKMTENRVRHMPIMDGEKLVGIVSIGDIMKRVLDLAVVENKQMKNYITG